MIQQAYEPAPIVKVMINIGALFDIATGTYLQGMRGEWILNGGQATLEGVVGIGNNFKTTIQNYKQFKAMSRMSPNCSGSTYDTEVNVHEWHLADLISRIPELAGEDILDTMRWVITDKTVYGGTEWYEKQRGFLQGKIKDRAKLLVKTPFWNRERTGPLEIILPTFTSMDSFTEFETDDVETMQNKNELGDSGGNTIHMRQGLAKLRLLMEAPRLNSGGYNWLSMTAHIGKESTMQNAGPGGSVPIQKLKHLKNGDKIKGTTDKFTFMTHNCWHCFNSMPMIEDDKTPTYPSDSTDKHKMDTDLNLVTLRNLRSKSGITGMAQQIIVSQTEGVLDGLTEFHHIKEQGRYGLEGSNINYALSLLPDVKLGRTTVRGKIDTDHKLRRALNITSEMCQMSYLWRTLEEGLLCTPKELYDDLKAKGYDWDVLLATRGWWTVDEKAHPEPFLSTMDLLKMRKGEYHPYWHPPLPTKP